MSVQPAIAIDELKTRYEALPPIPDSPGERRWFDRLRDFNDLVEFGEPTAETLRYFKREYPAPEYARLVAGAEELAALVMEAWGENKDTFQ